MKSNLLQGDCLERIKEIPDESVGAVISDPPYHLTSGDSSGFCGEEWDGGDIAFRGDIWRECRRVLKPGGYLAAFGGTRTFHRMAVAIEDEGFLIRDMLTWIYASGCPKHKDLGRTTGVPEMNGYRAGLAPACEPITLGQKPFGEGRKYPHVAREFNTGGLNIDRTRNGVSPGNDEAGGDRYPKNVMLEREAAEEMCAYHTATNIRQAFYCPKASPKERETGARSGTEAKIHSIFTKKTFSHPARFNTHKTVKPIALMQWLVCLLTPPNGNVLDPFMGSGSTGIACMKEGVDFIGIELMDDHFAIAKSRIEHFASQKLL